MDFLIWSFGSKQKEYSLMLVGVLNLIDYTQYWFIRNGNIRNTGEIFLAPVISNLKYATAININFQVYVYLFLTALLSLKFPLPL